MAIRKAVQVLREWARVKNVLRKKHTHRSESDEGYTRETSFWWIEEVVKYEST